MRASFLAAEAATKKSPWCLKHPLRPTYFRASASKRRASFSKIDLGILPKTRHLPASYCSPKPASDGSVSHPTSYAARSDVSEKWDLQWRLILSIGNQRVLGRRYICRNERRPNPYRPGGSRMAGASHISAYRPHQRAIPRAGVVDDCLISARNLFSRSAKLRFYVAGQRQVNVTVRPEHRSIGDAGISRG
jgi:hypothetical protein